MADPPPSEPRSSSPSDGPLFTVIITAYDRRTYLARAIRSVLGQSFPRSGYEIIVVKNFEDGSIDRLIAENGLVGIVRTEPELGIHLKVALDHARGRITAFLNDDDLWEPAKLSYTAERFAREPRLGFDATSYTVIDESDRPIDAAKDRFAAIGRFAAAPGAEIRAGPASSEAELDRFVAANPGSDSTVAIRTEILRRFSTELAELPSSVDTFLLTCGLLSGADLLIEYRPLTLLRVHAENMSRATDDSASAYFAKYARSMAGFARARAHLLRMAERAGNTWLVDRWSTKLRSLEHFSKMARGDLERREAFEELREELKRGRSAERGLVASALLYLVAPSLSRSVNFLVGRRIAGA